MLDHLSYGTYAVNPLLWARKVNEILMHLIKFLESVLYMSYTWSETPAHGFNAEIHVSTFAVGDS